MKNFRSCFILHLVIAFFAAFPLLSQQISALPPKDPPIAVGNITKLVLYDAETDEAIAAFDPLTSGAVIDTALFGNSFSIVAEVSGLVASVVFALDASDPYRTESLAPFALNGDNGGDFAPWIPAAGSHTVSATPFYAGEQGATLTVTFTISAGGATESGDAFIEQGGLVSIEAESFFTSSAVGSDAWQKKTDASSPNPAPAGYSGQAAMYAADDAVQSNFSPGTGPEMTYEVVFETAGTYYFWVRLFAGDYNANRLHGGIDGNWQVGQETKASYLVIWSYNSWQWTNERATNGERAFIEVPAPGAYTINIWLQKDGLFFDKLVLSDDPAYVPAGPGPAESSRQSCQSCGPMAEFTASVVGLTASFDAGASSGDVVSWTWDFGDGASGAGQAASHTYGAAGDYAVTLTVADAQGAVDSITKTVSAGETGGAFLEQDGLLVMEAEHAHGFTAGSGASWSEATDKEGYSGASAIQALPNTGVLIGSGYAGTSPEMRFDVELSQGGRFWVWVRMWAASDLDNSVHAGYDGAGAVEAIEQSVYGSWQWTRNRKFSSEDAYLDVESGPHAVSIWMREDGVYIDRVLLTSDESYAPVGQGPAESPRATNTRPDPVVSVSPGTVVNYGDVVTFDASGSTDPEGDALTFEWYVVDGDETLVGTDPVYVHTAAESGTSEFIRVKVSDGQLVSELDVTLTLRSGAHMYYYVKDNLGSVRAVVDDLGGVAGYDDYYPFGLVMDGRSEQQEETAENFTGHELDEETGLIYAGARFYLPDIGRWITSDPMDTQYPNLSPYNYVFDNPLSWIDPNGECPECSEGEASQLEAYYWQFRNGNMSLGDIQSIIGNNAILVAGFNQISHEQAYLEALNPELAMFFSASLQLAGLTIENVVELAHARTEAVSQTKAEYMMAIFEEGIPLGLMLNLPEIAIGNPTRSFGEVFRSYSSNRLPTIFEKNVGHIFRDAPGHFKIDTQVNRAMIINTVARNTFKVGIDIRGTAWYARQLSDGRQVWAAVRNGQIRNAGINLSPRTFNPRSGLSRTKR